MIFDSNRTSLGSSIPMAEGYNCSYGPALALIESANNDLAVFKAMLDSDAYECQIRRESTGSVMESELTSLHEAVFAGIWAKIKELFSKLAAKIKAIFHVFISKIHSLYMKDKELAKKYGPEIKRKTNIGNLEVKWRKLKKDDVPSIEFNSSDIIAAAARIAGKLYAGDKTPESDEITRTVVKDMSGFDGIDSVSELKEKIEEEELDDEETLQIKEIRNGAYGIISYMENCEKAEKEFNKESKQIIKACEEAVKRTDKATSSFAKENPGDNEVTSDAQHLYTVCVKIQDIMLASVDAYKTVNTIIHKQYKAAFMKMVAANDEKLAENALYLDMIAEAAEDQVDDVINSAISSEGSELSELNNASRNVIDGDVSNDPDKLVYADDPDYKPAKTSGTVDTDYTESAVFNALLY